MSKLLYRLNNNKIYLNITKNNKNIGNISSIIFNNTSFINKVFVDEEYRFNNYGTYLINSTEIILRQYYYDVNLIKLVVKQNPDEYLTYFFNKLGYNKYDITYTNYEINYQYELVPMYKNINNFTKF
tara:strand:- start:315 stop:695 length:381 start_codon:yes stop_codon:yes gene_type:complete